MFFFSACPGVRSVLVFVSTIVRASCAILGRMWFKLNWAEFSFQTTKNIALFFSFSTLSFKWSSGGKARRESQWVSKCRQKCKGNGRHKSAWNENPILFFVFSRVSFVSLILDRNTSQPLLDSHQSTKGSLRQNLLWLFEKMDVWKREQQRSSALYLSLLKKSEL